MMQTVLPWFVIGGKNNNKKTFNSIILKQKLLFKALFHLELSINK